MASFRCVVERLINRAINEARHVFCFTCIINEFEEEERAKLEAAMRTMDRYINVAKAIGRDEDVKAAVAFWEEEVNNKLNKLDTKTKETCFFGFCPDCVWRYKKGKELATRMKHIEQLKQKVEKFENIELPRRLPDIEPYIELHRHLPDIEPYSSNHYISFKSRESTYKELLDALIDDNNYITVLQGMRGIGKTTLAKQVGRELKQYEQFTHVIHTTLSSNFNLTKTQYDIAGPLGLNLMACNLEMATIKLWRRLTNGEKILLILDDVWYPLNFDAIGIPNRDDCKGCRVLVTTSCKGIIMDCVKIIELELLSEEDAWIMFKTYAGISDSSSKSVTDKGREIAKECKQLPIAIAVIAHRCKGHRDRIHEWDVTLKSLKNRVYMDRDDDLFQIYSVLEYSYKFLADVEAKRLFLLCSLFQESEEISIEVLTRFIIGAGHFGDNYGNYNDARKRVIQAKYELLYQYLLLKAGEKHVKMHDLVRSMAQSIAYHEQMQVVINLSETNQKLFVERERNIAYLSCEGKDVDLFSCKFEGSNLEILLVKVDRDEDHKCIEVPNSFFQNIVKLQVFYFSGNDRRPLSLPDSIQSLTNIRSILIDRVDLGNISILENLQSLETLDLVQCTINELPSEISKLEKFKLLKLEYCEIRMNNPFEVIERCLSLEELYFIDSFNGFCQEVTFPELQIYHIRKGRAVMNDSLSKYVVFPSNDDAYCFSKATLNYCMQTAEVLRLNGIIGEWRNLMPEIVPIDRGMDDLVELCLSCISQLHCLIDAIGNSQVPTVLSMLVVLKLNKMENLEELFSGTLSFHSLKNLEKLSIKDCKHLQSFFKCKLNLCNLKTIKLQSCSMLVSLYQLLTSQNLVQLETLKISHCDRLENIIADERIEESREEIDDGVNNNNCLRSMFPKLKLLDIEGCPLLESIFPFLIVQDLPVLQTIKIRRCDGLKYIFAQYQHAEFGSLRQLELSQLPNFIGIFCISNHPISLSEKGSSSTSNHGSKAQLQLDLDPMKCNISSRDTTATTIPFVDGHYSVSNSHFLKNKCIGPVYPQLEVFDIEGCPLLESIFPSLIVQDLPVLETIKIKRCDGLKYIFGQYQYEKFSSLRQLELCQLPNFIDMFCKSNHPISVSEKGSSSTSNHGSKAQLQFDSDPMKYNILSWDTTTSTIPLVDGHYLESNSYYLNIWERAQCLRIPSKILYNIKKIELSQFSKIKSVFIPSIAPRMLLETLTIRNCDELKNIIDFVGDFDSDRNNWGNVFPKMKELYIEGCPNMEYIFGHYTDDHQNQVEIQLQLLELKCLSLCNLPNLVAMCPKHYRIRFPPLAKLELNKCSEAAIKSMSHVRIHPVSESLDSTIIKEYGDGQIAIASPPISMTKPLTTSKTNDDQGEDSSETNDQGENAIIVGAFSPSMLFIP